VPEQLSVSTQPTEAHSLTQKNKKKKTKQKQKQRKTPKNMSKVFDKTGEANNSTKKGSPPPTHREEQLALYVVQRVHQLLDAGPQLRLNFSLRRASLSYEVG